MTDQRKMIAADKVSGAKMEIAPEIVCKPIGFLRKVVAMASISGAILILAPGKAPSPMIFALPAMGFH